MLGLPSELLGLTLPDPRSAGRPSDRRKRGDGQGAPRRSAATWTPTGRAARGHQRWRRVLLVAMYCHTNLAMRQRAPLFGTSGGRPIGHALTESERMIDSDPGCPRSAPR